MKLVKKKVSKKGVDKMNNLKQKSTGGVIGRVYDGKDQYKFVKNNIPYQLNPGYVIDNKMNTESNLSSKILDSPLNSQEKTPISPLKDIEEDKDIVYSVTSDINLKKIIKQRCDNLQDFIDHVLNIYEQLKNMKTFSCRNVVVKNLDNLEEDITNLENNLEKTLNVMEIYGGGFFKNPFKNVFRKNKGENHDKQLNLSKTRKKLGDVMYKIENLLRDTKQIYYQLNSGSDDPYFEKKLNNINTSFANVLPELEDFRILLLHYTAALYLFKIAWDDYQEEDFSTCFVKYNTKLLETNFSMKNFVGWTPGTKQKYLRNYGQKPIQNSSSGTLIGSGSSSNDCPDGKIENPITKRYITINGKIYKDLVKQGVLQQQQDIIKVNDVKKRSSCDK